MFKSCTLPDPVRVGNEWVLPSGRRFPVIEGGSDEGDPVTIADILANPAYEIPKGAMRDQLEAAAAAEAAKNGTDEKVTITAEQAASLVDRLGKLEQRATERPKSSRDQLQADVDAAFSLMNAGSEQRKTGRDVSDSAETIARETRTELRRRDIVDAATAAKFLDPTDAVAELLKAEGDPATLVADLAKRKPHWVTVRTEMDLTDAGGAPVDPGLASYAKQIAASRNA